MSTLIPTTDYVLELLHNDNWINVIDGVPCDSSVVAFHGFATLDDELKEIQGVGLYTDQFGFLTNMPFYDSVEIDQWKEVPDSIFEPFFDRV
jgi:hypothetical protein